MELVVDHLVTAWTDLETPTETFADLGMKPVYGGQHGDGTTEMSVLCFQDGSYLEFLTNVPGREPTRWPDGVAAGAGPFAWGVQVGDVVAHLQSAMSRGQFAAGPTYGRRERPDGRLVEWDRGVVGEESVRSLLPFVIADRTPRRYRVTPTESVVNAPVSGVGEILLAVEDIEAAVETFGDVYRFPTAERTRKPDRGLEVGTFPGEPVGLLSPSTDAGGTAAAGPTGRWVRDRLDEYGQRPCGCLLRARDLGTVRHDHDLTDAAEWPGGEVAWFDDDRVGRWLGVLEREDR